MASFGFSGIEELMAALHEISNLSDDTVEQLLLAEATVVEKAQKQTGLAMGVHRTGVTLDSISHGKLKKTANGGRALYVYPRGVNSKGNRNAEVAFINEFGKTNQKARPFIKTANETCADEAVDAAAKVYANYLASKNL